MSRFRCNTCRGEYDDVSPRGTPYFHVCPPVTVVRARDHNDQAVERPLRGYAGITLVGSAAERQVRIAAGADPATVWIERDRRSVARLAARDENTRRHEADAQRTRVIKAEGRGRTAIDPLPPPEAPIDDAP